MILTILTVVALNIQGESMFPPENVLKKETYQNKTFSTTGIYPWNGIRLKEIISPKTTNITPEILLSLTYNASEVPGMMLAGHPSLQGIEKQHTYIFVDNDKQFINRTFYSKEVGNAEWGPKISGVIREQYKYAPLRELLIFVTLFKSSSDAVTDRISRKSKAQVPIQLQKNYPLPSGLTIGDRMWVTSHTNIVFIKGKADVFIVFSDKTQENPEFLEAVAWGVLYRVLQYPDISGEKNASMSIIHKTTNNQLGNATNMQGVAMVPASTLKKLGVTIKTTRDENKWTMSLIKGNRTITFNAFDWYLNENGKPKRLDRPAFPHHNDLVVPLRSVCDSMGIKLAVKGNNVIIE